MKVSLKDCQNSKLPEVQSTILTRDQYELLNIISKAHDKSVSEYIQKALLETMKAEMKLVPEHILPNVRSLPFCSFPFKSTRR